MSLIDSIKDIFGNRPDLVNLLAYPQTRVREAGKIADIQDGEAWKASPILGKKWNLGLALNADGMAIFGKTVSYSVWPIFVSILNFPPKIRSRTENLILVGLYPGPTAPSSMNMFFKPLIKELRTLYEGTYKVIISPRFKTHNNSQPYIIDHYFLLFLLYRNRDL